VRAFLIFGSVIVYQVLATTIFVRVIDPVLLPQIGLLWVAYLAEEPAAAAARVNAVFIRNLFYAAAVGYLDGRAALAPHGLHAAVYAGAYVLQRLLGSEQGQNRAATFLTTMISVGSVSLLLWWLKGLLIRFASIAPFRPWDIAANAALGGAIAVLVFPLIARVLQGTDSGYGRRLS
jgi:hypothetical protein